MKVAAASFSYPQSPGDRSRWIQALRGGKHAVEAGRPYAFHLEQERGPDGTLQPTATVFLTNRECPWRCVMCDLWRNTLDQSVPIGAIPAQIRMAVAQLPPARQIKLYNGGSFFDPKAIPREDFAEIRSLVGDFERVIVECHPALVGPACGEFGAALEGQLEVAMGLETAHQEVLEKLNKRMTLASFKKAAEDLGAMEIDLRVFILVNPPFLPVAEAAGWVERSIDFALDCGAAVISLIPTRTGNGAMDELARQGEFAEPNLAMLETAHAYGIDRARGRGRIFADLWDLRRFSKCSECFARREARLHAMNCQQQIPAEVQCKCR